VEENEVQFDTICRLQKELMWAAKLEEEKIADLGTEITGLTMQMKRFEDGAKKDETRIEALEKEVDTLKRQLSASTLENKAVQAKLAIKEEAAKKEELLVESMQAEVDSLKKQMSAALSANASLKAKIAAFEIARAEQ
jgi:hypothetical protein